MFGYIKPFKPEMKMGEFDTFKAIYCGLCKQLSNSFGPFSSLTLSYDFTFIATIALGLAPQCQGFKKCSCVANPLKKKQCHNSCDELTFCSSCALLMIYYKVLDNIKDSGFIGKFKAICMFPFASFARRKAKKIYPKADEIIKNAMVNQAIIEKSDSVSLDKSADPTANSLGLLCEMLSDDQSQKKILYRFGYLVGRYVYFADALDDLTDDLKHKEYNPFLKKFMPEDKSISEIKEYAIGLINITIAEIAPAYELLSLRRFKPILDNIIYLGLHNSIKEITTKAQKKVSKTNEQSL